MDTITTYLDSLFASLPDNDKTRQAKADMLANMRDYYRDLLREGKSEEAAIGAVISAFGSIDELRADLGMPAQASATTTQSDPTDAEEEADEDAITETELRSFWHMADQFATQIALGVLLCAVSIALPAYTGGGRWVGFCFTITLTQDVGLASTTSMDHAHFRRRFTRNLCNLRPA